jgi:hypothetical protein
MSYEILIGGDEPINGWTVCKICLNVERSSAVIGRRWRCADCGSTAANDTQQTLGAYLEENPAHVIEKNLTQWNAVKGVRPAYKMLRSARYKCLLALSRQRTSGVS